MRTQPSLTVSRTMPVCVAALLCLVPHVRAQSGATFTASAQVKTSGGVAATAPVSLIVDRFSTDADRDEITAAAKSGGTEAVRRLLLPRPPIGTLKVGNQSTAIKYVYARTTGAGRLITAVSGSPIVFIGAGVPGAKPKTGFDLGLVILEVTASGPGHGELVPATKVRVDEQGAIVTEDYSGDVVKLSGVTGK